MGSRKISVEQKRPGAMTLRKRVYRFLVNKVIGEFIGFVTGFWAAGLVSLFFETRSLGNLWGLLAKKRVVDDSVFTNLQWVISAIIGFIVLELVNGFIRARKAEIESILKGSGRITLSQERRLE